VGFLLIAVVASVVGSLFLWWRHHRPTTFMSSIEQFEREMDALGRDAPESTDRRPGRRRVDRPSPIVPAPEQGDLARKLRDARRHVGDTARGATDEER
jgi:hypothetical protein